MKTTSPAAAMALAALCAKNKLLVEKSFRHLTPPALQALDQQLLLEFQTLGASDCASATIVVAVHQKRTSNNKPKSNNVIWCSHRLVYDAWHIVTWTSLQICQHHHKWWKMP